jgi:hypothetical protein
LGGQKHGVGYLKIGLAHGILGKLTAAIDLRDFGLGEGAENVGQYVAAVVGITPCLVRHDQNIHDFVLL